MILFFYLRRICLFTAPILLLPWAATGQVVQCYDKDREVIQPRMAQNCTGEVLNEADAKRLKAKLHRERVKRALRPKSERERGRRGHGTGFFVTADGMIVTNNHVIEDCRKVIWIDTTDGQQGTARVVATEKANDLALLKSTLRAPAVAAFQNPVKIDAGGEVTVIGYGTRKLAPIRPKLISGTYRRSNRTGTRLEMELAVRPGNSGGPVLDAAGHVIGVVFAQLNTVAVFKKRGELILDRGYAISNPVALRFLDRNKVAYHSATTGEPRPPETVFREAKPFIARVSCPR